MFPTAPDWSESACLMMQLDVAMGMGAYSAAIYEKTSLPPRVREVARFASPLRMAVPSV